jgi:hypothetical protein
MILYLLKKVMRRQLLSINIALMTANCIAFKIVNRLGRRCCWRIKTGLSSYVILGILVISSCKSAYLCAQVGILGTCWFVDVWLMLRMSLLFRYVLATVVYLLLNSYRWIPQLVALGRVWDNLDESQRDMIRARNLSSNILHRRYPPLIGP